MAHRKRRIIFRVFAVFVVLLLVLVIALPVWLPWVLRPAAKSLGLSYSNYDREGYSRFRLCDVTLAIDSSTFQAREAEALVPTVWLWKVVSQQNSQPFLRVSSWTYETRPKPSNQIASATSVFTNVAPLGNLFALLKTWAPHVTATNGTVRIKEKFEVEISEAAWRGGSLVARTTLPGNHSLNLNADILSHKAIRIKAAADKLQAHSEFVVTNTGQSIQISGSVFWLSNRIAFDADFPRVGSLPQTAQVRADEFVIDGSALKLDSYRDLRGSLLVKWDAAGRGEREGETQFTVDLSASAMPSSAELSPLDIQIHASGNTNAARIDTARITLPWMNAELSEGTALEFKPPFLSQPAQLRVSADLAKQSRYPASGRLEGGAILFPGTNLYPRVSFALDGDQVAVSNLLTRALWLEGEFEWPLARLKGTRVTLPDGSEAVLTGTVNLASNSVERGELNVSGTFGRDMLPAGYSFETISATAQVSGPFTNLVHSGKLDMRQFQIPAGKPTEVGVEWAGKGRDVEKAAVSIVAENAELKFAGALDTADQLQRLTISELSLHSSRRGDFKLEQPWIVSFRKSGNGTSTGGWNLSSSPMKWVGDQRSVAIQGEVYWPTQGTIQLSAHNLSSDLLEDFLVFTNTPTVLKQLTIDAAWTNGPVTFRVDSAAGFQAKPGYEFSFEARMSGNGRGIVIEDLSIASSTQIVCRAEGTLPFSLLPGATNGLVQIDAQGPLQLHAFTETNSALWAELANRLPLRLLNPNVRAEVSGTWEKPQGTVRAELDRLEINLKKPVPTVSMLEFAVDMDRELATARLNVLIQEQQVRASGELPLGRGFWSGLRRDRLLPDFGQATGNVKIQNARIASFVEFAPEILSPQGEFTLDVKLGRNYELTGEAVIYNGGTRPLASLGPVRAIDARMLFNRTELILTNLSAEIGGQRIRATGVAQLDDKMWLEKRMPSFEMRVTGTNVPLVRQPSVLVRADLNLAITNSASSNGFVSGTVRLRDSFFLSSLKDLAPGKVTSTKRRPPFFSIETEPFAAWRLGIQVDGDQFLKAQSPFFRGTVSATVRLEGTLREPLALGEVRINTGMITFPFGSLDVQQGFVSMTSGNPYHPQLFVNAAAQRMGYDIRMEASGPADQPVVQFSSSPPLSSEQIVLMLTTGQTPQGVASATTTRQRAQGVAMFVGKNLLTELGIGGSGDARLTIRSGEQVTETGRPTYDVEYKLNDDWSVVGEYDRFSQYNLGFKWKVYSK